MSLRTGGFKRSIRRPRGNPRGKFQNSIVWCAPLRCIRLLLLLETMFDTRFQECRSKSPKDSFVSNYICLLFTLDMFEGSGLSKASAKHSSSTISARRSLRCNMASMTRSIWRDTSYLRTSISQSLWMKGLLRSNLAL